MNFFSLDLAIFGSHAGQTDLTKKYASVHDISERDLL